MLASCNWEWGRKHIILHSQTNSNHTHCMFKHSSECSKHLHVAQPPPPPTHTYTHVNTTTNTDQRPYIHVVQTSHTHCYNTSPQLHSSHTLLQHFTSAALTTHTATTLHLSCTHHTHCYNTSPQLHSSHTLLQHFTSAALTRATSITVIQLTLHCHGWENTELFTADTHTDKNTAVQLESIQLLKMDLESGLLTRTH